MIVSVDALKDSFLKAGIKPAVVAALDPARPLLEQGMDSADFPLCVLAMEKALGIRIPDKDAMGLKTLNDAVAYLAGRTA